MYLYVKVAVEMKTMTVGEFKTHFSKVIEWVKNGNKVAVTYGKKKEIVGYFTPKPSTPTEKRQLGIMKDKANAVFSENFKMSEEDFLKQ